MQAIQFTELIPTLKPVIGFASEMFTESGKLAEYLSGDSRDQFPA